MKREIVAEVGVAIAAAAPVVLVMNDLAFKFPWHAFPGEGLDSF